jgi:hypothetical protein
LTEQATLPLEAPYEPLGDPGLLNEGVSCAVCHQWTGKPHSAQGGLARFGDGLAPGRLFFGPRADPAPNAFHQSEASPLFSEPHRLCQNCHNVELDRDGDGRIVKGHDLVLQTLYDEWRDYAEAGGASCVDCHMPLTERTRAAESALIPFEQDRDAPPRRVRNHSFVAVDYPLELDERQDSLHPARVALLRGAASLSLVAGTTKLESAKLGGSEVRFDVEVSNTGTGHNLPGGFAFVRQMWLEVTVKDSAGRALAASGLLARASDDLCDESVLDARNPVSAFVVGCRAADALLVNFQQKLVDRVAVLTDNAGTVALDARKQPKLTEADGARETWLQHLTGGPVTRRRVFDGQAVPALAPGEVRRFAYRFALPNLDAQSARGQLRLAIRLLFRPLPPYFVRALAKHQAPNERPQLAPLVDNLRIFEMASVETLID